MKHSLRFSYFLGLLSGVTFLLLTGCAQIVSPTGGEKDTEPPTLDSLGSTPNFQTNFTKQNIELIFDEWLELKDVKSQIIVSPFMEDYEVRLKKKTVIFEFGETPLLDDITYIINFGSAIVDFTENNPVTNLRVVFSTGDFIDSLGFSGNVIDAYTGDPIESAVVLVHENLTDTTVLKNKPLYIARTDEEGNFKIENMKADTFQVFAIVETRNNYLYDPASESFAFLESNIVLTDSVNYIVDLKLSKASKGGNKLLEKDLKDYGKIKLGFSNSPKEINISTEPDLKRLYTLVENDSLLIWYHHPDTTAWSLLVQQDTLLNDTLEIKGGLDPADANLDLVCILESEQTISSNPTRELSIPFSHPIFRIDDTKIQMTLDSTTTPLPVELSRDSLDHRKLAIDFEWKEGAAYNLNLYPGAIESLHQRTNDSLAYNFTFKTAEDLANLKLNIAVPDSTQRYLLWVEMENGERVKSEVLLGQRNYVLDYKGLDPLEYAVRCIEDTVPNDQWDAVNYAEGRQPERVLLKNLGKLLANFDREEDWSIAF